MKYPTVFHLLAREFGRAKIPFVLVGGFALNFYKYGRATADFVQMHLKYFFNPQVNECWKRKRAVNVPFSLK